MADTTQKNNPLHGQTLQTIMEYLVSTKGWEYLGEEVNIRKTPWARTKVESLYLYVKRKEAKKTETV